MLQIVAGRGILEMRREGLVASDLCLLILFQMATDFSEAGQQLLMGQKIDIFDVVIGLFVPRLLLRWLAGVNPLQDAQTTEVFQLQLQFPDRLRTAHELSGLTSSSFFYLLHHYNDL